MNKPRDAGAFEGKVTSLVETTRNLSIPQILMLRRLTMADPESLRWSTQRQLQVVFDVILGKAVERQDRANLNAARDQNLEPLLPPIATRADEDRQVLADLLNRMLGPQVKSPGRIEAERTQTAFENLLSRRLPPTPPRVPRVHIPVREPQPLFPQQGGMQATAALRKGRQGLAPAMKRTDEDLRDEQRASVDFATLFDDTICGHIGKILDLLRIPETDDDEGGYGDQPGISGSARVPFMVAPAFSAVFEDVVRRFILPTMRASRHVQTLANSYNWSQVGGEQLIEIIHGPEQNNPVLHNWDLRWNALKSETAKGNKETPWTLFRDDAKQHNYTPPDRENIRILLDIIRYEPDSIAKSWRELQQLYSQEFAPGGRQERARDGAFRDGLLKWSARLPDHLGEFLAIKAGFTFRACTPDYLRALLTNFGRSEAERYRAAPYLSQFVADLTE